MSFPEDRRLCRLSFKKKSGMPEFLPAFSYTGTGIETGIFMGQSTTRWDASRFAKRRRPLLLTVSSVSGSMAVHNCVQPMSLFGELGADPCKMDVAGGVVDGLVLDLACRKCIRHWFSLVPSCLCPTTELFSFDS